MDMKNLKKTLTVVVVSFLGTMTAFAQKNIARAIGDFTADTGKSGIYQSISDTEPNQPIYFELYRFSLPKKQEKKLDNIKKAFDQDKADAYDSFVKNDTDKSKTNRSIAYGGKLDKRLFVGWPNKERNYRFLFFSDKKDTCYRYVYGVEWHYEGKKVTGCVVKGYGLNPKKVSKAYKQVIAHSADATTSRTGVPLFMGNDLKLTDSGLWMKKGTVEMRDGKTILKTGGKELIIQPDGTITMDNGKGSVALIDKDGNMKLADGQTVLPVVTDGATVNMNLDQVLKKDVIQQFGNLRAAYLSNIKEGNIDNTTLLTGLANSILDLCKNKGSQMSADEKEVCITGLKDMQQQTPDKYIKGLFGVAINVLK